MKLKQTIIGLIIFLGLLTTLASTTYADETTNTSTFSINAKAAIAVDAQSGKIFYSQDATTPLPIASITKIISLLVVEDQIKAGKLSLQDTVTISPEIAAISVHPDLSNVPLIAGQSYSVEELIHASLIQSANAAVMALAEKVAGSQDKFVDMMKTTLNQLGITDAKIVNVSGLNNSYLGTLIYPGSSSEDENELSAQDVAIVARHLINTYPEILQISQTTQETFGANTASPTVMTNWNRMLPGFSDEKTGVDGLKTGTTDLAGACFVGTITQDNRRVITVVLHANDHPNNSSARFIETSKLMDYALSQWQYVEVLPANHTLPNLKQIKVLDGKTLTMPVTNQKPLYLWVQTGTDVKTIKYNYQLSGKSIEHKQLLAPAKKGVVIGQIIPNNPADPYGYLTKDLQKATYGKIITTQKAEKANLFVIWGRKVKDFITNIF